MRGGRRPRTDAVARRVDAARRLEAEADLGDEGDRFPIHLMGRVAPAPDGIHRRALHRSAEQGKLAIMKGVLERAKADAACDAGSWGIAQIHNKFHNKK